MRVLVFIKEVRDIKIPLEYDERARRIRPEGYVPQLNPPDLASLDAAIGIKENIPSTRITLIHLGRAAGERWIRDGLALGCDAGLRIWDEGLEEVKPAGKALIFARVAEMLGFDLILTGNRSQDTATGQVGILLARYLNLPFVSSVLSLEPDNQKNTIVFRKSLAKGYQEKVQCRLPLMATMTSRENFNRYASFPALVEAMQKEIPCWNLSRMGLPRNLIEAKNSQLHYSPPNFPKQRVKPIPSPDASLPAFERIAKLLEGTVRRREGKVIKKDENLAAEELFQVLLQEGWLGSSGGER